VGKLVLVDQLFHEQRFSEDALLNQPRHIRNELHQEEQRSRGAEGQRRKSFKIFAPMP